MHKVYRQFWSEDEVDDLFEMFGVNNNWQVQKTTSRGYDEALSGNTPEADARYLAGDQSRIADALIVDIHHVPQHFTEKLRRVLHDDWSETTSVNSWCFDESWSINRYLGKSKGKFEWHQDTLSFFKFNSNKSPEEIFLSNTRPGRVISISVALNNKREYNNGDFTIDAGDGKKTPVNLDKGDMCMFTSDTFHSVEPVTGEGVRYALIIWVTDGDKHKEWNMHYADNIKTGQ